MKCVTNPEKNNRFMDMQDDRFDYESFKVRAIAALQLGKDDALLAGREDTYGGWAVAGSPILKTTITVKRLKEKGYEPMLDYYHKVTF